MNATRLQQPAGPVRGGGRNAFHERGLPTLLAAVSLLVLTCIPCFSATVTLQQNLNGYTGTRDAWLNESLKTRNYGGDTSLRVQYSDGLSDSTLLRFDLPVLNFQSVAAATLRLYLYDTYSMASGNALEIKPYRIVPGKSWDENIYSGQSGYGVNWRYRDNGQTLEWTGQNGAWNDKADDGNGTRKIKPVGGTVPDAIAPTNWADWSVQPTVARWYEGYENNGFALFMNSLQGSGTIAAGLFYSRESSDTPHRPMLTITYQGAEIAWGGYATAAWDTNTVNWSAGGHRCTYGQGDFVTFPDGAAHPAVQVTASGVAPASMTISNQNTPYSFTGGSIGGSGGLVKLGTGELTLNSSNSYAGPTLIRGGRLIVTSNSAFGNTTAGTVVAEGATLELRAVNYLAAEPLNLAGSGLAGGGALRAAGGHSAFAGPVTLGSDASVTVDAEADLTLANAVSGNFSLTKNGAGTLTFSGTVSNTYGGETLVRQGVLVLANASGLAVPGDLAIGDGLGAALVRLEAHGQLAPSSRVTVRTSGQLDLNGHGAAVAGLTLAGGEVLTGAGTLRLDGDVSSFGDVPGLIAGRVDLGGGARVFDVAPGAATNDLIVTADLRNGDLIKSGTGRLLLSGTNQFAGGVSLLAGVLTASNAASLGRDASPVTVGDGAQLQLHGNVTVAVPDKLLVLNGAGAAAFNESTSGALCSAVGSNVWGGRVLLQSPATIASQPGAALHLAGRVDAAGYTLTVQADGDVALDGEVSGPKAGLAKQGGGALRLGGDQPNTYGGPTLVQEGQLVLTKTTGAAVPGQLVIGSGLVPATVVCLADAQLAAGCSAVIRQLGRLDLNGFNATLAGLTLNGGTVTTGPGELALTGPLSGGGSEGQLLGQVRFVGTQDVQVETGSTVTIGASASGAGFVKRGPGRLVLTNANTFEARCVITEGSVAVNNDPAKGFGLGPAEVVADGPATVAGTGSLNGPLAVRNGARLSPGLDAPANPAERIGRLLVSNSVTLGADGGLVIECAGPSPLADELDLRNGGDLVLEWNARLELVGALAGSRPYVVVRGARSIVGNFEALPPDSPLPGQPGWFIHYGNHRIYFSRAAQPMTYFRAFSTNGVCLVMWRTAEEVETKSFDLFQWGGETWIPVNSEPIPARNPDGAVYLLVNPLAHWNATYRFRLVANTASGPEEFEYERIVTELAFSAPPEAIPGGVVLRWFSRVDETYDLLGTADLNQPFQVLHTGLVATPPQCVLTNLTTWPEGYYWLRLAP